MKLSGSLSKKNLFLLIGCLVILFSLPLILSSVKQPQTKDFQKDVLAQGATDWPQVQRDPQRTGYSPETLGTNFKVAWTYPFQPDKIFPQVQAIVYQGKVFVGTEGANGQVASIYALAAKTGSLVWKYPVGAPILGSVAAGANKVFFGAMDGAVYALDVNSGNQVWKKQVSPDLGFSTAPVLADNKIMLGGTDGIFYALDPGNGNILWQYNVGSPILQTAAWDNGKVFFGAMDMRVWALNSANGSLAWKSEKIYGRAFKDYWPVVAQSKIVIRPMGGFPEGLPVGFPPFTWGPTSAEWDWYMTNGPTVTAGNLASIPEAMNTQDEAMATYEANPDSYEYNLNVLDANTGEAFLVPHWDRAQALNGPPAPPCVDRDGKLIIPVYYMNSGWGRLDLGIRRIVDILYDHTNYWGEPLENNPYGYNNRPAGFGNDDESHNVSCASNLVFGFHVSEDTSIAYTGAFDLNKRRWINIPSFELMNDQMAHNTQGGGGNPPSIAGGMVYHIVLHEIIARSTQ